MANKAFNIKVIFAFLVTLSFAYGVYEALSYDFLAKLFPLYISLVLVVLAVVNMIQEIMASFKKSQDVSAGVGDLEADWDIPMTEVWKRLSFFIGLILIFYVGVWIIGYPISITIFIILFYRYIAKTRWRSSFIAGLAGMGFLILTSKVLNMNWPEGLIKLPWPLG
jgi:hypothetical protein